MSYAISVTFAIVGTKFCHNIEQYVVDTSTHPVTSVDEWFCIQIAKVNAVCAWKTFTLTMLSEVCRASTYFTPIASIRGCIWFV